MVCYSLVQRTTAESEQMYTDHNLKAFHTEAIQEWLVMVICRPAFLFQISEAERVLGFQ